MQNNSFETRPPNPFRGFRFDRTAVALLFSNLVTILLAVLQQWNIYDVMLVYWAQSVIIGLYSWKRMEDYKKAWPEISQSDDEAARKDNWSRLPGRWFFPVHYGGFHLLYLVFICKMILDRAETHLSNITAISIIACVMVFFINQRYTYLQNRWRDMENKTSTPGSMFLFPYARIIPMHAVIGLAAKQQAHSAGLLVLFLGLKTLADLFMHMAQHARSGDQNTIEETSQQACS